MSTCVYLCPPVSTCVHLCLPVSTCVYFRVYLLSTYLLSKPLSFLCFHLDLGRHERNTRWTPATPARPRRRRETRNHTANSKQQPQHTTQSPNTKGRREQDRDALERLDECSTSRSRTSSHCHCGADERGMPAQTIDGGKLPTKENADCLRDNGDGGGGETRRRATDER